MHASFAETPFYTPHGSAIARFLGSGDEAIDLPLLEKSDLIAAYPRHFMTPALQGALHEQQVEYATTSGTTSDRLQLMRRKGWWADEFERGYRYCPVLADFSMQRDPKASLTTAICSANICYLDNPVYENRISGNTLYLNARPNPNTWSAQDIERIGQELHRHAPRLLEVDPVYLALYLCKRAEFGIADALYRPSAITCSYEYLTAPVKAYLTSSFGCPVLGLYGSTELGVLFIEDGHGMFRRCPERSICELLPIIPQQHIYELVVTSWKNELMPLLRYCTGDLVELFPDIPPRARYLENEALPVKALHGRKRDVLLRDDGSRASTGMVDKAISQSGWAGLLYQLEFTPGRLAFRYTIPPGQGHAGEPAPPSFLHQWFGRRFKVIAEHVREIQPESSGKFATVRQLASAMSS
jgi:phenylacetate-CoA ligase